MKFSKQNIPDVSGEKKEGAIGFFGLYLRILSTQVEYAIATSTTGPETIILVLRIK